MSTDRSIHFISGLPRSGSTLLSALLRQNPRFQAGISSPVCELFSGLLAGMSLREGSRSITDLQRTRVLGGLLENFYGESERPVVFDSNRGWSAKLSTLRLVNPRVKVICMVRNVAWILDSIESLLRRNALHASKLFDNAERAHIYARCEALTSNNRLVGSAWSSSKEAFYSGDAAHTLFIDYEHLAQSPRAVMSLIYQFLEEESFDHDFGGVQFSEAEFDGELATPDLHTVRPEVSFIARRTVLPPDLFDRYSQLSFWKDATTPTSANIVRTR